MPPPMLDRQSDAALINRIMNDPSVRPTIGGTGPIDLAPLVANQGNVVLCGEHGGAVFHKLLPGLYELHTAVLPAGRGAWTLQAGADALFHIFTRTDCVEVVTKVPPENRPAEAATKRIGMTYDWLSPCGWEVKGVNRPVPIYSMKFTDWPRTCADVLAPIGVWFHAEIQSQLARLGRPPIEHIEDDFHNAAAGAVVAMIRGGQAMKGVTYYNRRAGIAKTPMIRIINADPLVLDLHDCRVSVYGDDFEVL